MVLNESMVLPYYKIERTNDGKDFFYSHIGYFNFWDEYLILHTKESEGKIFKVLVNRGNYKFKGGEATEEQKNSFANAFATSVYFQKPEEMFEDFPELMSGFLEVFMRSIIPTPEAHDNELRKWWNKTFGKKQKD